MHEKLITWYFNAPMLYCQTNLWGWMGTETKMRDCGSAGASYRQSRA